MGDAEPVVLGAMFLVLGQSAIKLDGIPIILLGVRESAAIGQQIAKAEVQIGGLAAKFWFITALLHENAVEVEKLGNKLHAQGFNAFIGAEILQPAVETLEQCIRGVLEQVEIGIG